MPLICPFVLLLGLGRRRLQESLSRLDRRLPIGADVSVHRLLRRLRDVP